MVGFQGNNAEVQQDTIDAIANLTNANIADREYMVTLTQTISRLTEELTKTQEKLVAALAALAEANTKIKKWNKTCKSRYSVIQALFL